jgi:hypothetical protein
MDLRVMLEDQTEHLGRKKFGCWQEMESFKQTGWHKGYKGSFWFFKRHSVLLIFAT